MIQDNPRSLKAAGLLLRPDRSSTAERKHLQQSFATIQDTGSQHHAHVKSFDVYAGIHARPIPARDLQPTGPILR